LSIKINFRKYNETLINKLLYIHCSIGFRRAGIPHTIWVYYAQT